MSFTKRTVLGQKRLQNRPPQAPQDSQRPGLGCLDETRVAEDVRGRGSSLPSGAVPVNLVVAMTP